MLCQLLLMAFAMVLRSQDIADKLVQHLALTKYVAILALAPANCAWGAARDLCAGSEAMARPAGRSAAAGGYPPRTRRATALLMALALLDVSSYFMHCIGALRLRGYRVMP